MAGRRSHSGREQRRERAGLYTPNNRCRPEAPLTSLPKLTPVKNVGEDSRRGEGEKGRTTKDKKKNDNKKYKKKIMKRQRGGMVVKAELQLSGACQTKPGALAMIFSEAHEEQES